MSLTADLLSLPLELRLMIYDCLLSCDSVYVKIAGYGDCKLPGNALFSVSKQIYEEASMVLTSRNAGGMQIDHHVGRVGRRITFTLTAGTKTTLQRLRNCEAWVCALSRHIDWNDYRQASLGNCMRRLVDCLRQNKFANQPTCTMRLTVMFDMARWHHPRRFDFERDEHGRVIGGWVYREPPWPTEWTTGFKIGEARNGAMTGIYQLEVWFKLMQLRELMRHVRTELFKHITNIELTSNVEDQPLPTGFTCQLISPEKMIFHNDKSEEVGTLQLTASKRTTVHGISLPEHLTPSVTWERYTDDWEVKAIQEKDAYYKTLEMAKANEAAVQGAKRKAAQVTSKEKARVAKEAARQVKA